MIYIQEKHEKQEFLKFHHLQKEVINLESEVYENLRIPIISYNIHQADFKINKQFNKKFTLKKIQIMKEFLVKESLSNQILDIKLKEFISNPLAESEIVPMVSINSKFCAFFNQNVKKELQKFEIVQNLEYFEVCFHKQKINNEESIIISFYE